MKKPYFGIVFCLILFFSLCNAAAEERTCAAVADKVLRLHVSAASDAPGDQSRKLLVRDALLATLTPLLRDCPDLSAAARVTEAQLPILQQVAEQTLRDCGCADPVAVSLARESFSVRDYESFSLPAGDYLALRAVIGSGAGHNWWCVVFPPLCLAASEEEEADALAVFSQGEQQLITAQGRILRFRILEWFETLSAALTPDA